jgi:hypothetical protein
VNEARLANYHLEPSTDECTCSLDQRCGGIVRTDPDCPEHSRMPPAGDLMKSHFHPIQATPRHLVGTHFLR